MSTFESEMLLSSHVSDTAKMSKLGTQTSLDNTKRLFRKLQILI